MQHSFIFDKVHSWESSQEDVYLGSAKEAVDWLLQGYNASIIAYGPTSTGKTYTMEGPRLIEGDPLRGVIPRSFETLFDKLKSQKNIVVKASYIQIYMENLSDLLAPGTSPLTIREDKKQGLRVEGLSEWPVSNVHDVWNLLQKGASSRTTATTKLNEMSSRSHAIFVVHVTKNEEDGSFKSSKLKLVDLAGSERASMTGATGKRLDECKKINQSLMALGNVISSLSSQLSHIPYRDSKTLGRFSWRKLQDYSDCNDLTLLCFIPRIRIIELKKLSTLKFSNRAKKIVNVAIVNEESNKDNLISIYEKELKKLKSELQMKDELIGRQSMDSKENMYFRTKSSQRTNSLCEKSLSPENFVGLNPSDKEESLKLMILKQRDIMVALSERLNERDQLIEEMREEMQAYDQYCLNLERKLEDEDLETFSSKFLDKLSHANAVNLQNSKGFLRKIVVQLNKVI